MRCRPLGLIGILVTVSVLTVDALPQGFSPVSLAVEAAKREGKTSIAIRLSSSHEISTPMKFIDRFAGRSVWLVRTDARRPQGIAGLGMIYTTHLLHVTRRLAEARRMSTNCHAALPEGWPAPTPSLSATWTFGGTAVVDGVTVTVSSDDRVATLFPLQTYLLVGEPCASGGLWLEFEIPVSGDGKLLTTSGAPMKPETTVDELASQLKAIRTSTPERTTGQGRSN